MDFNKLLLQAKDGEPETVSELLEIYKPLLTKNSIINGTFDEDLYQKLYI
ncbi:MAG: helix-turn-helix domain-containing protein [Blautia sp.]